MLNVGKSFFNLYLIVINYTHQNFVKKFLIKQIDYEIISLFNGGISSFGRYLDGGF